MQKKRCGVCNIILEKNSYIFENNVHDELKFKLSRKKGSQNEPMHKLQRYIHSLHSNSEKSSLLTSNTFSFAWSPPNTFEKTYMFMHTNIFTQPFRKNRMQLKSNFKQCLTSLNSEFSFSKSDCYTKVSELTLPYYLPIGGKMIGFKCIIVTWNTNKIIQDLNSSYLIHCRLMDLCLVFKFPYYFTFSFWYLK